MVRGFKLLNIFLIIFSCTLLTAVLIIYTLRKLVSFNVVLTYRISGIPFFVYLFIALVFLSLIVAIMLYYGMRVGQRRLIQKLQWLIMGNYSHPIFKKTAQPVKLLTSYTDTVIDEQLNAVRDRFVELNNLLKQTTQESAPLNLEEKAKLLEEERHRIARELHDSVSQQLFAAMMLLSAVNYSLADTNEALQQQLHMIEKTINEAQTEMRALLLHLRPVSLEGKTLKQGIERLLGELQSKASLDVVAQLDEVVLESNVEDNLFRVIQELISNILRHAKAKRVEIYLTQTEQAILLRLVDNGIGFDTNQASAGYGLMHMRERVSAIGGTVNIISVPNQGTIVDIKMVK